MKKCLSLVHLIMICLLPVLMVAQAALPQARIVNLSIAPQQVVVLHVRPGYVSSVRVLEEVSSVVLGSASECSAWKVPGSRRLVTRRSRPRMFPSG